MNWPRGGLTSAGLGGWVSAVELWCSFMSRAPSGKTLGLSPGNRSVLGDSSADSDSDKCYSWVLGWNLSKGKL